MTAGTTYQRFSYDSSGKLVAVDYSTNSGSTYTTYYYVRNGQGDVTKLIDSCGNTVVQYTYVSWGKLISTTGTLATTLGANNPFRYRGYVYDTETQWYYLQSRYYNPEIGRFISSDVLLSTGQGVLGHNAYAYCPNNPINAFDDDGEWSLPNWAKIVIGVVATVAAVALTVATGGALAPVIATVAVTTVAGAAKGAVEHRVKTGSWEGAGKAAFDGACDGFMWGGISAFGGAARRAIKIAKNGVVIGESMGRVNSAAKSLGASTYRGMPGYKLVKLFKGEAAANSFGMNNNQAWITRMVKWGVRIYDIGIDPVRSSRSAAYAMEKLVTAGYHLLTGV